jgi:hypothetical protein
MLTTPLPVCYLRMVDRLRGPESSVAAFVGD